MFEMQHMDRDVINSKLKFQEMLFYEGCLYTVWDRKQRNHKRKKLFAAFMQFKKFSPNYW